MKQRQISSTIMVVAIALGIFFTIILQVATAKTHEDIGNVLTQETTMKDSAKTGRSLDAFTMAFMGLSLGCMLIASAVHWTRSQRHFIENQIKRLSTFIEAKNSVTFHVVRESSANPIVGITKEIVENRNAALRECENRRKAIIDTISAAETDIIRMWG